MSRIRRLATLATVAAVGVMALSCVGNNSPPTSGEVPHPSDTSFDPLRLESHDDVRRAELSRRAKRPAGDPERERGLNYAGVVKGLRDADKQPKPAEAMPPTACRSVEPAPMHTDEFSGPHYVHSRTVADFESSSGFGFWRMQVFKNKRDVWVASKDIDRVELVSLLTDYEPSAYVLDQMATPPLTRQAKRRPLDEFEQRGLEAVRRGEDLVWTREAPKRMFGAIRAEKSCLDCHSSAKEGDLLGAFTYYLDVPVDQVNK